MNFWEWLFSVLFGRRRPSEQSTRPAPRPAPHRGPPTPPAPPTPQAPTNTPPPPPPVQPPPVQPPPSPPVDIDPNQIPAFSLALGCIDATVTQDACNAFIAGVERLTERKLSEIQTGEDKIVIQRLANHPPGAMTVSQVQDALRAIGVFPGGEVDGIYGYRTTSAVRLFQELVRTQDGKADVRPDGLFGPKTQAELQSWIARGRKADWRPKPGEYERWIGFLERVKTKHLSDPSMETRKIEAFNGATNTLKASAWDMTGPGNIHLIGVRRKDFTGKFDDVFVLLIKGLVFKFQGSTEPGASDSSEGWPFLVPAQHIYRFGWHQNHQLALRPLPNGALVARSRNNRTLEPEDYENGLKPNTTINIHWAGRGLTFNVATWSHGCQVITGGLYINPADQLIDCRAFAATNNGALLADPRLTRGAYTMLVDLVTALSGDMPSNVVRYTLVNESDLVLDAGIAQSLKEARDRVVDDVT